MIENWKYEKQQKSRTKIVVMGDEISTNYQISIMKHKIKQTMR